MTLASWNAEERMAGFTPFSVSFKGVHMHPD